MDGLRMVIKVNAQGQVAVEGPIDNKVIAYGMLEAVVVLKPRTMLSNDAIERLHRAWNRAFEGRGPAPVLVVVDPGSSLDIVRRES